MSDGKFPAHPVLLVDDEVHALHGFEIALRSGGISNVLALADGVEVLPLLARQEVELLLLDLWMPRLSGEEVLVQVAQSHPEVPVIVVTGVNDVDTAVRCIKSGAADYLVKPVDKNRLLTTVGRGIELRELHRENTRLRRGLLVADLEHPEVFADIVHAGQAMRAVLQYVEAIARTVHPVLITGESGVGKELVARAIHAASGLTGRFVAVNVAGLDDNVFADTLFGHRKGAYTGADEARDGLIAQAAGGTLLLDEIGDLSAASQLKLLRLLQEREYHPLGSDLPKRTDARIVVATNQDPQLLGRSGKLRGDLYYRLSTHHVHVPPLRSRLDDLPALVQCFLEEAARDQGRKPPTVPKELLPLLRSYSFPGNVRELRSLVVDAVSRHRAGILSLESFRRVIGGPTTGHGSATSDAAAGDDASLLASADRLPTIQQAGQQLIAEALRRAGGNQAVAARMLGISRQALNRRLNRDKG